MSIRFAVSNLFTTVFNFLTPIGPLLVRFWLAYIFFAAGIVKLESWSSTIALFSYEYHVPFISAETAAILATTIELAWSLLLVLGLGGRFMYFVLFVYNAIAVFSYPYLLTAAGFVGLQQHINWGLLLMLMMFYGSGKLSVDYWLHKKMHRTAKPKVMPNHEKLAATRSLSGSYTQTQ